MSTLPATDSPQADTHLKPAGATSGTGAGPATAFCLPSMPAEALDSVVQQLAQAFPGERLLIASPDQGEEQAHAAGPMLVPYPVQRTGSEWVLNGADYAAAARVVAERGLAAAILLGSDAASMSMASLLQLRQALSQGADLVVPRYHVGPEEGLVNSALLYPLTRALFGVDVRFPLPLDAGLSGRMLQRLAVPAAKSGGSQESGLVWPVAEAALAGFTVRQADGIERTLPHPQEADLNVLFPAVTSSLFADIETKATFWQRARALPASPAQSPAGSSSGATLDAEEMYSLVEGYRLAFNNLREIWALVLPPQSLLALKKLSVSTADTFSFPPSLWARVVYDFAIAFHLRTLNRGHLLGAMTPLYLAWVASLLRETGGAPSNEATVTRTAAVFSQEKAYFVSRWRWPDRFNP